MLKHYFRLENLKAEAASMVANDSTDWGWGFGNRFTDRSTEVLWPQLLEFVDSINRTPDQQTKELYAQTAARIIALSMHTIGQMAVESHAEELVNNVATAQKATDSIIKKVSGKKKD